MSTKEVRKERMKGGQQSEHWMDNALDHFPHMWGFRGPGSRPQSSLTTQTSLGTELRTPNPALYIWTRPTHKPNNFGPVKVEAFVAETNLCVTQQISRTHTQGCKRVKSTGGVDIAQH